MRRFVEAPNDPNGSTTFLKRKWIGKNKLLLATAGIMPVALLAAFVGIALATSSPTVSTGAVKDVADNSAVLEASVAPAGEQTTYRFEYGPTSALGLLTPAASAGAGTATKAVTYKISGLIPGTPYYYRIDASNASGAASGTTAIFRTAGNPPPGATTGATEYLTSSSVTMTGVVYPQNQVTSYYFRYGATVAYGLQTAAASVPAGAVPVAVTAQLSGLEPGLMFHYQLVAVHSNAGPTSGADASFETYPSPAPQPTVTASTTPRAIHGAPYTFLTSGKVINSSATPASLACLGTVQITFRYKYRVVAKVSAPVQADCSYAGAATLRRLPGHGRGRVVTVHVYVHFSGDHYLAGAGARRSRVTLG
jgi:hypothetical protein